MVIVLVSKKFQSSCFHFCIQFCCVSGGTPTKNYVSVSSTESNDNISCLLMPEETCSTIKYALTNIVRMGMFWINTIYIDKYFEVQTHPLTQHRNRRQVAQDKTDGDPLMIQLPEINSELFQTWTITIACSRLCVLQTDLLLFAKSFQNNPVIQFEKISFSNIKIGLGNVHVVFNEVIFLNTLVTDQVQTEYELGHMMLHFSRSKFENQLSENNAFGLILNNTLTTAVALAECEFLFAKTYIKVSQLSYESMKTSYNSSEIMFDTDNVCLSTFQTVHLSGSSFSDVSLVEISSIRLSLDFKDCIAEDSTGGLKLTNPDPGLLDSWINVGIYNCTFLNNTKLGSGGAIAVEFFPWDSSILGSINFVKIKYSTFRKNKVDRTGPLVSQGGAVSFHSSSTGTHCQKLSVQIESNLFEDNMATDGGGAIWLSSGCLDTLISNSTFRVTDVMYDSPKGVFVLGYSQISINASVFARELKHTSPSLLHLQILTHEGKVEQLNLDVTCHAWYKVTIYSRFIEEQAKEFQISCTSCPVTSYVASEGHFDISYSFSEPNVTVQSSDLSLTDFLCKPCPPGANCPGNDFHVKPNFWGYRADNEIIVHQCPADYCCTGENCLGFDPCSSHRSGVLCGSCEEDYSLSMLSSQCIEGDSCNSHWLWPLVVLALIIYVMLYTFKNDIFTIPNFLVQKMCKSTRAPGNDDVHYYIDKGYFGIVTYFVQIKAVMGLSVSFDHSREIDQFFTNIESFVRLALNFEISNISNDTCVLENLTTTDKMMFKLVFLFAIYICWNIMFLLVYLIEHLIGQLVINTGKLAKLKMKLIDGLVEIMKYTYLGFTSIIFYSLTCTLVAGKYVWFNDGSVQCYSKWQIVMIIFCLSYILPYPFLTYFGMKLLKSRRISRHFFFIASCFPLPVILYWLYLSYKDQVIEDMTDNDAEKGEQVIYNGFMGGFRESEEGTQYWESVLMLRRLLISATILIPNPLIQLSVCLAMCMAFLVHHTHTKPFKNKFSNKAETLSLTLLCGVAAINMLKASFLYTEISLQGPQVEILRNLELMEILFVISLIGFIVFFEAALKIAMRVKGISQRQVQSAGVKSGLKVQQFNQNWHAQSQARKIHPESNSGPSSPDLDERVSTPSGVFCPVAPESVESTVSQGHQIETGPQAIWVQPGKKQVVQVKPSEELVIHVQPDDVDNQGESHGI